MPLGRFFPICFVCAALLSCAAQSTSSTNDGGITGVVLTEDGQLAVGAKVCTSFRQGNRTRINCLVPTDKEGRFTIGHLKALAYQVFAINEAEGYSIENQTPGQAVTITVDHLWADVTIRQHSRGGVLVGSITDGLSGKKINDAQLRYTDLDSNGSGGTTMVKGDFEITVPSDSSLLIVVMSEGYCGWVYTDPSSPSRPVLKLASGERKRLDIQLQPLPPKP